MAVSVPVVLASGVLSQSGQTSLETDSVSPSANALVIAVFASRGTSGAAHAITDSFSGGLGAWTQYTTNQGDTRVSINIARASASPGSGTVTVTYDANQSRQCWQLLESTGVDPATPVAEWNIDDEVSAALSLPLIGVETGNVLLGAAAVRNGVPNPGQAATDILLQDSGGGSNIGLITYYTQSGFGAAISPGDGDNAAAVAIEIASATDAPQSTLTIVRQFDSPNAQPRGIAYDGRSLWLSDSGANLLYQIDPTNFTVIHSYSTPSLSYRSLAWDGRTLWGCEDNNDRIDQINPSNGTIIKSFDSPGAGPRGLAWDGRTLWNSDDGTDEIHQLDPADGKIIQTLTPPFTGPQGMFWMGGTLWAATNDRDHVYQLTVPNMRQMRGFATPGIETHGMCWDGRHIWLCESMDEIIYELALS